MQTVQARCPHCQQMLQFPAEWASKAMRCKHCRRAFQARANSSQSSNVQVAAPAMSVAPAKPAPIPMAKPATAVAAGSPPLVSSPFSVAQHDSPPPASPSRRRNHAQSTLMLVVMFFVLFVLGAGGASFVVYKAVTMEPPTPPRQYVKGDGGKTVYVPNRPATDGSNDKKNIPDDGAKEPPPPTDGPPKKDPPPKKGPPKKLPPKDLGNKDGKKKPPVFTNDPFPRRALLISVNNYLFYNTVHYGNAQGFSGPAYPGSSTSVLRDRFSRPPMNFPATQVTELSDGIPREARRGHSTQRSVIETTIKDFLDSSREQDRIIVFYAGHAASIEDKSYLIPIDGNIKDPETLVPLKWVYDRLAGCKAQQKILVLDTFRYSPSRGFELPGTGEGEEGAMPEAFEKDTLNPPPGVQVWVSCLKEQNSVELEGGSAFMQALCQSLQGGGEMKGLSNPTQPIPIESLVETVNKRLKDLVASEKRTQVSRLTGKAPEMMVAYNREEPLPGQMILKEPVVAGGKGAPRAQVDSILEIFKQLPPVRETRATDISLLEGDKLRGFFSAKTLDGYKADAKDLAELKNKYKANAEGFAKDFPMRAAVLDAIDAMKATESLKLQEVLTKADSDPKRKKGFRAKQEPIGIATFKLEQALAAMKEADEMRDKETSKRWQANFDYTRARLQSRIVYLIEYNYLLGRILADDLPELAPGQSGWRLGSGVKIAVTEKKAKDYAKDTRKLWDRITKDYPETPWSLLAQREKSITLGLQWRAKSD